MLRLTIYDHTDPATFVTKAFAFAERIHTQTIPPGGTGAVWLRGHGDSTWELKPSAGRLLQDGGLYNPAKPTDSFYDVESETLQRFRRDAYPFVQRSLSEWEALTLGQHHGLPTRLLDWTSNPLVALFFAAEKHPDKDGAVFAYRRRSDSRFHVSMFQGQNPKKPDVVPDPLKVSGIKIVFPMLIADRLITQSGGFTIQDPLTCIMDRSGEDFAEEDLDLLELHKWIIPKTAKPTIMEELHRVSINRRTLFPGLDGVGKGIQVQEQFRKP